MYISASSKSVLFQSLAQRYFTRGAFLLYQWFEMDLIDFVRYKRLRDLGTNPIYIVSSWYVLMWTIHLYGNLDVCVMILWGVNGVTVFNRSGEVYWESFEKQRAF